MHELEILDQLVRLNRIDEFGGFGVLLEEQFRTLHAENEDLLRCFRLMHDNCKKEEERCDALKAENEALKAIVKDAIRLAESDANGGGVDWYFCSKEWEDKLKTQADIEYESDKAYWKAQEK